MANQGEAQIPASKVVEFDEVQSFRVGKRVFYFTSNDEGGLIKNVAFISCVEDGKRNADGDLVVDLFVMEGKYRSSYFVQDVACENKVGGFRFITDRDR